MVFFRQKYGLPWEFIKYFPLGYWQSLVGTVIVYFSLMGNRDVLNLDEQLSVVSNKSVISQFMDTKFFCDLKI